MYFINLLNGSILCTFYTFHDQCGNCNDYIGLVDDDLCSCKNMLFKFPTCVTMPVKTTCDYCTLPVNKLPTATPPNVQYCQRAQMKLLFKPHKKTKWFTNRTTAAVIR